MNKPTLKISELQKQGLLNENPNQFEPIINKRLLRLKFYFDNPNLSQSNKLASFEVASFEKAINLLVQFELKGCSIRAAFLTPSNQKLSKISGFRFEYKTHILYQQLKGI